MQPNDNIFIADQQACGPEQINGINLPDEHDDNNLSTLSYEYMIYSDDDDDDSLSSENENDNNKTLATIEKYRRKLTGGCKRLRNNDDITAKDYVVSQKPDVLIKYIKILLKDAVQKERKIKRLQAEFDQRSREVADLKEIYEKLKKKR